MYQQLPGNYSFDDAEEPFAESVGRQCALAVTCLLVASYLPDLGHKLFHILP